MMSPSPLLASLLSFGVLFFPGIARAEGADAGKNPAFERPNWAYFEMGEFVYQRNCVACHGEKGDGKGEMAVQLEPKPRAFSSGLFKFRSTPPGKLPTTEDLMATIRGGRSGTGMGMFTHLSEEEIRAVAEYVKFFSRRWRNPEFFAEPIAMPDVPEWMQKDAELSRHAERGKEIFAQACAACHGEKGDGNGPAAAMLKDAWDNAIRPADLRNPHLKCGDELRDIFKTLVTGYDGTPMVSFANALTAGQMWDLVAFIAKLRRDESKTR